MIDTIKKRLDCLLHGHIPSDNRTSGFGWKERPIHSAYCLNCGSKNL